MTQSTDDASSRDPFSSFISGLDMEGIDGISCETVHPIIEEIVRVADQFDQWQSMIDPIEQQVSACVSNEATDWVIDHAAEMDGIEVVTDAEGQVEHIVMTPDYLAELLHDFADLVRVCDQAVRARLGDDEQSRLPVAFRQQLLLLWRLSVTHHKQDMLGFNRVLEHLMEMVYGFRALLRVYGVVLEDQDADAASDDVPAAGDDDGSA